MEDYLEESLLPSSDEDDRLKEALDLSMFDKKKITTVKRDVNKSVNSVKFKHSPLNVTPEFQSYVGKQLADMLDKCIEEKYENTPEMSSPRSGGIKLFEVSSEILTDYNFCEHSNVKNDSNVTKKIKYFKKHGDDDEMSEMEKISSAAVSPEWILEKHCIKGWSKPKGTEIKVIKNVDGELEIVASPFAHG